VATRARKKVPALLPRELPAEPADDGGLIAGDDEELNEAPGARRSIAPQPPLRSRE